MLEEEETVERARMDPGRQAQLDFGSAVRPGASNLAHNMGLYSTSSARGTRSTGAARLARTLRLKQMDSLRAPGRWPARGLAGHPRGAVPGALREWIC